jgi:hypothetical protein
MRTRGLLPTAAIAAAIALLSAPHHAGAQVDRFGIGWTAGAAYVTDLNSHPLPGFEANPRSIAPGLGYTLGLHMEKWLDGGARFGVRAQGSFQQPRADLAWRGEHRVMNAYSADLSLLFRLLSPARTGAVLPYLMMGGGGSWYDVGPEDDFAGTDASYDGRLSPLPLAIVGLGADTPPIGRWDNDPLRIRFELANHMVVRSPLRRTSDWQRHGSVHQLRFTVGVYTAR